MAYGYKEDMSKAYVNDVFRKKRLTLQNAVVVPWKSNERTAFLKFEHGLIDSDIIGIRDFSIDCTAPQTVSVAGWWYDNTNVILLVQNTYGSPVTIKSGTGTYVRVVYMNHK